MSLIQQTHILEDHVSSGSSPTACDEFHSMVELIRAAEGLGARLQWLKERAAHHLSECPACQNKVRHYIKRDGLTH